jgi:alpha-beta hydrolase superfamily lysophospholipase
MKLLRFDFANRRLRWIAGSLALVLAASFGAGCAQLESRQRAWIFQPAKETWWAGSSATDGMADRWIAFTSRESGDPVTLHALWLPQVNESTAPVLLYLHGARWNVSGSASRIRRMHDLGFSVLAVDYRGFGKSSDVLPSESMAYEDARAAWDFLAAAYPTNKRFVFGHSLGGAIAIQLASNVDDASGLMVEGTFTSIPDVFASMRWGWLPLGPLITQRFDSASRIDKVKAPVLVVHGSADQLINPTLGKALYDRATAAKRFVLVEGGSHHSTNQVGQPEYRSAIAELFGLGVDASATTAKAE